MIGLSFKKKFYGRNNNYPISFKLLCVANPLLCRRNVSEIEIKQAMDVLMKFGLKRHLFLLLHYNIEYPTPMKDVNLKDVVQKTFGVQVGYSDHTLGIEVPIAVVAMPQLCRNTYIGQNCWDQIMWLH
jgi:N-acetylneuraminate synthase/N,N'-diacetyllegionaminate synthase